MYIYMCVCVCVCGLVWFYGISTIEGLLMTNPLYTYKHFYFKQSTQT